jgi:acyl transferase domain-containing protein
VANTAIGHSFGQLSALCIAGSIMLKNPFRFVTGGSQLMGDDWGPESGSMFSVECSVGKLVDARDGEASGLLDTIDV